MPEPIDQLALALAAAQAKMSNAAFNKVNPHFKSQYADLAAIREATLPALTAHGLSIVQIPILNFEGALILRTLLLHKSGQFLEGEYPIGDGTPQQRGSALTYAKRYSWAAMCGIAAEEDDDANAAEGAAKNSKPLKQGVADITLGQDELPKAKSRPIYDELIKEMRAIKTRENLTKWGLENTPRIYSMHADFQKFFREEYANQITAIAEGGTLKEQLEASIAYEAQKPL